MTEAPQRDDSEACVLLEQYVELHNQQVVEGADGVDDLFTGDVDIDVEGTAISALRRYAMVTSFRAHELLIWEISEDGDDATATYAWRSNPRLGGTIRLERDGDKIARLTITPGYSRMFAALTVRQDNPFLVP